MQTPRSDSRFDDSPGADTGALGGGEDVDRRDKSASVAGGAVDRVEEGPRPPRVRFDLSLRNAIRRASISPSDTSPPSLMNRNKTVKTYGIINAAKSWLIRAVRPPFDVMRRYFVGGIDQKLEALQWLHPKLDALHVKADQLSTILKIIESVRAETSRDVSAIFSKAESIQSRMEDLSIRVRTPIKVDDTTYAIRILDGFILVPQTDLLLLLMLYDAGPEGLEPGTRRVLTRLLQPGMVFVDVGAHVGTLTVAGARRVGPTGKVFAFEPTPATFELLERTLDLNGLKWATARRVACGCRREQRTLYLGPVLGHSSLFPLHEGYDASSAESMIASESSVDVEVVPLDDFFHPGERVDFVKIDVEGAEIEVLTGMRRVIADNPELAIVAEFGPSHLKRVGLDARSWFQAFAAHGLVAFAIEELSGVCRPAHVDELATMNSVNIAFVRPDSVFQHRLVS